MRAKSLISMRKVGFLRGKPRIQVNDREVYLQNNPSNHRVLMRWELENYLFDKQVLQAYCSANSLSFNEISYDSLVTDIGNQNLKDEIGKIRNICGITTSINTEAFKLTLSKYISTEMAVFSELESCVFGPAGNA
jgi:hypothetical protein